MFNLPLYQAMFKTFHGLRRVTRKDMQDFSLTQGTPKVLRSISKNPNCKLKEVAEDVDIEPATASRMINDLEKKGMIIRKTDDKSRRSIQLEATPLGKQTIKQWDQHCAEVEKQAIEGIDEQELQQFMQTLNHIYFNLTGKQLK